MGDRAGAIAGTGGAGEPGPRETERSDGFPRGQGDAALIVAAAHVAPDQRIRPQRHRTGRMLGLANTAVEPDEGEAVAVISPPKVDWADSDGVVASMGRPHSRPRCIACGLCSLLLHVREFHGASAGRAPPRWGPKAHVGRPGPSGRQERLRSSKFL